MAALEQELLTYADRLPDLLSKQGKYVLIRGTEIVDTFDSYEDALKVGYAKFGLDPFLVKKISPAEQVLYFSRGFAPCPA